VSDLAWFESKTSPGCEQVAECGDAETAPVPVGGKLEIVVTEDHTGSEPKLREVDATVATMSGAATLAMREKPTHDGAGEGDGKFEETGIRVEGVLVFRVGFDVDVFGFLVRPQCVVDVRI